MLRLEKQVLLGLLLVPLTAIFSRQDQPLKAHTRVRLPGVDEFANPEFGNLWEDQLEVLPVPGQPTQLIMASICQDLVPPVIIKLE